MSSIWPRCGEPNGRHHFHFYINRTQILFHFALHNILIRCLVDYTQTCYLYTCGCEQKKIVFLSNINQRCSSHQHISTDRIRFVQFIVVFCCCLLFVIALKYAVTVAYICEILCCLPIGYSHMLLQHIHSHTTGD